MNRLFCGSLVGACLFVLALATPAAAAKLRQPSVLAGGPVIVQPVPHAVPPYAMQPYAAQLPVVVNVPVPTTDPCCPTPCITYRSRGEHRSCLDDKPGVSLTVAVKNPQTGCVVHVPICVPPCCVDEPCIDSRCGILQRGIVTYDYKCGFRIVFTFDKHGDLLVTSIY